MKGVRNGKENTGRADTEIQGRQGDAGQGGATARAGGGRGGRLPIGQGAGPRPEPPNVVLAAGAWLAGIRGVLSGAAATARYCLPCASCPDEAGHCGGCPCCAPDAPLDLTAHYTLWT